MLYDCNNLHVSFERVFEPQLNRKPIVILSNYDGCSILRIYQAKAVGTTMIGAGIDDEFTVKRIKIEKDCFI